MELLDTFHRWRLKGTPSGIGLDTALGLRIAESSADITGPSFLSLVYPRGDWRFALYRHQLARFEFTSRVNALFADAPAPEGVDPGIAGVVRDQDTLFSLEFDIVSYGIATAYRVTEAFSLGLGLSFSNGSMLAMNEEYLPDDDSLESYFAPGSYLPDRLQKRDTVTFDGTDWTLSTGFLWSITERWRLGGFYRQGSDFELKFETRPGPASPTIPAPTFSSPFALPRVYRLGIAYRSAGGRLTTAFEWDRVEYSTAVKSLDPRLAGAAVDNGSEFHIGAEYAFIGSTPVIALRLGAWLDPDHRTRAAADEPFSRALNRGGDDEIHYAVGFGLAFERFQVDLALDLSELRDTASVSAIFSF